MRFENCWKCNWIIVERNTFERNLEKAENMLFNGSRHRKRQRNNNREYAHMEHTARQLEGNHSTDKLNLIGKLSITGNGRQSIIYLYSNSNFFPCINRRGEENIEK